MDEKIDLWHVSYSDSLKDIQKEGLTFERADTCVGGQDKGIYFFTHLNFAKAWVDTQLKYNGPYAILCHAQTDKKDITFPNWKLDLWFNRYLLSKMPLFLRKHFNDKMDRNGNVPLNLPTQYAVRDDCGHDEWFSEKKGIISGLSFTENGCFLNFLKYEQNKISAPNDAALAGKRKSHPIQIKLDCDMDEDFLGPVDTLVNYLCQKDKDFLNYYNLQLQKELGRKFKTGAIKCVKNNPIKVNASYYNYLEDDEFISFYAIFGSLLAYANAFYNNPKRTSEIILNRLNLFKKNR